MAELLSDDQITAAVRDLPLWRVQDGSLRREVRNKTFMDGITLVATVAAIAEQLGHHPDIDIRWTTVSFSLTTHAAGGITANDPALAHRIDEAVSQALS